MYIYFVILSVVKRNPLFLHEIEWKNNGFLFTTPNIFELIKNTWITKKSDLINLIYVCT